MKITELHQSIDLPTQDTANVPLSKAEQLDELLLFFRENPSAGKADFLALTKALKVSEEELDSLAFTLCKSLCSKLGRHVNHSKEPVNDEELTKGIAHEMEHTNDEYIARLIALDHLAEIPDYYSKIVAIDKTSPY